MANTKNDRKDLEKGNQRKNQKELNQIALGNTDIKNTSLTNNNDLLSLPKTDGTGANPAAATPHSLIVHEDEKDKDRYEEGNNKDQKNAPTA
ncbi:MULTISPECIES: hypothetical protein [unclassified Pedobacter]|uniref:hypothetical protein n=1 Tax=unclassified Pedobacter TaxID=2628915 RepID=UPI001DD29B48|nr:MULTISPECIES: hypothetical protein [unclassified Pedobacter]CAH0275928.1 hypothetical protein SRABI36_03877 [Pedobacter sp. Bi36]CAH0296009.1 hypothetical protein SRABI126_04207 [Pedobacter sp. Bi126]